MTDSIETRFVQFADGQNRDELLTFWNALRASVDGADADLRSDPDFLFAAGGLLNKRKDMISFALLSRDGAPIAMFPIEQIKDAKIPGRYFSIMHHPSNLSEMAVLSRPDDMLPACKALVQALRKKSPSVAGFAMEGIDMACPLHAALLQILPQGMVLARDPKPQYFVDLEGYQSIDDYFSSRSANFRKTIKRGRSRLEKLGGYDFGTAGPDGSWSLADIRELDKLTWRAAEKEGDTPELLLQFVEKTMADIDARAAHNIRFVSIEGKPVASYFVTQYGEVVYGIKSNFNPEFSAASPSVVAFYHLVDEAIQAGASRIELLNGNAYSKPWSNNARQLARDIVFFNNMRGRAIYLSAKAAKAGKEILKRPSVDASSFRDKGQSRRAG